MKLALANAKKFIQKCEDPPGAPLTPEAETKTRLFSAASVSPLQKTTAPAAQSAPAEIVTSQSSQMHAQSTEPASADRKHFDARSASRRDHPRQPASMANVAQAAEILKKTEDVRRSYTYVRKSMQAEQHARQLMRTLQQRSETTSPAYAHVKAQMSQIHLEKELHQERLHRALAKFNAATANVS